MRFVPSLLALGLCMCSGSGSRAATSRPMCMERLTDGPCPASYAEAVAPGSCSEFPSPMFLSECGGRQLVAVNIGVDDAIACSYSAAGVLVGSRQCSKPIRGCMCFYAGEMVPDNCDAGTTMVACEADAGTGSSR
jgi:hypothetical protein